MRYYQLTSMERYTISTLRKQGLNGAQIAREIGRHRSTLWREIKRNSSSGKYRPSKAVERTNGRRSRSRRNGHFGPEVFRAVERYVKLDWSPEQIANRLREEEGLSISHETIYQYIWREKRQGGTLYRHLRCSSKQRRKRHNSYDRRGRLEGKRHISERPASVESRQVVGHWEIDTVMGALGEDCIVTLVERKWGYAVVGKLSDRSTDELNERMLELLRQHPGWFKTITADNGTEFHGYEEIEQESGVRFYFATPYHSWERGSNENLNGLIRQYLPKGASMANITQRDCDRIAHCLNTRPRKRLGYRTPEECIYGLRRRIAARHRRTVTC